MKAILRLEDFLQAPTLPLWGATPAACSFIPMQIRLPCLELSSRVERWISARQWWETCSVSSSYKLLTEENTFSKTFVIRRYGVCLWAGWGYWRDKSGGWSAAAQLKTPTRRQGSGVRMDRLGWRPLKGGRNSNDHQFSCLFAGRVASANARTPPTLESSRRTQQPLHWVIAAANSEKRDKGCSWDGCGKRSSYRGTKRTMAPFFKRSQIFRGGAAMLTWRRRAAARIKRRCNIAASFRSKNGAQIRFVSLKKVYCV